jgi:hypothetical protein
MKEKKEYPCKSFFGTSHEWSKWEQYDQDVVQSKSGFESVFRMQKRHCLKCNYEEIETVRGLIRRDGSNW